MTLPQIRRLAQALAAGAALSCAVGGAQAAVVVVNPGDVALAPVLNQWFRTNYRDVSTGFASNTTAAITTTEARSGNGSVEMSLTSAAGKVDYAYIWGYQPGRTLANLTGLSYDWYRQGTSTNPGNQQPAMRLLIDADGSEATATDRGYLVWEQAYQADPTVLADRWVSSDALTGNFWQRRFTPGTTVEVYDLNLQEWLAGASPAGALVLGQSTAILGLEFGIGSGWAGSFRGFVDNVTYAFGTLPSTTFNFETVATRVPEPAGLALAGLALAGLAAGQRRRARRAATC